jgi:hypothetical protein
MGGMEPGAWVVGRRRQGSTSGWISGQVIEHGTGRGGVFTLLRLIEHTDWVDMAVTDTLREVGGPVQIWAPVRRAARTYHATDPRKYSNASCGVLIGRASAQYDAVPEDLLPADARRCPDCYAS